MFKRKERATKSDPCKFKARLVAKKFTQQFGIDYTKVYSPIIKHISIRMLFAIVAQDNLELKQLDIKTTFLHGNPDETIYKNQPEGFVDVLKSNYVRLLKKSQYGLKQSSKQCNKRFNN